MKLTEKEGEFVAEMAYEPRSQAWVHFDHVFQRKDYDRFLRKGWLEFRGNGSLREFRWTDAGRAALSEERAGEQ